MRIEDYDAVVDVTRPADIEAALRKRHGAERNAFWLSHGNDKYPAINILVRGDLAYVHYLPKHRHPGFASIGTVPGLSPGRDTNFYPSDSNEMLGILNDGVVRFEDALKVAQEFAISPAPPNSIRWFEL
jgi:hypothetical protein